MGIFRRKKKEQAGQPCCVNQHRSSNFDEAARRTARDQVAPVSALRYR